MTNIEQFTRELMLAHDIDYETAQYRANEFYINMENETPYVLNEWISVKDQLPEHDVKVLVITNAGFISFDFLPFENYITHWQTLPEPPKEK